MVTYKVTLLSEEHDINATIDCIDTSKVIKDVIHGSGHAVSVATCAKQSTILLRFLRAKSETDTES